MEEALLHKIIFTENTGRLFCSKLEACQLEKILEDKGVGVIMVSCRMDHIMIEHL